MHFNPRTREECDLFNFCAIYDQPFISIHAPARGVTVVFPWSYGHELISIHAPARGATSLESYTELSVSDFNPRTREGCDNILVS